MSDTQAETNCGYDSRPGTAEALVRRVVEIKHHGIGARSGKPRHPVFLRTRPDLEPAR